MAHRKTNQDVVMESMNYSKYGALSQTFIMQAIEQLCDKVIEQENELLKQPPGFIHMPSWIGVAKEIKANLSTREKFIENNIIDDNEFEHGMHKYQGERIIINKNE